MAQYQKIKSLRIAVITADVVKKYKSLGLNVNLTKNYALHLGISDKEYEIEGASILSDDEAVINESDAILQMNILSDENLSKLKENQILIGVLNPYLNENKLKDVSSNINCFSLDLYQEILGTINGDIIFPS